jgi:hypothetical protein
MKFDKRFLDIYGMVLPNPKTEEKPSDNGALFTSIAVILGFDSSDYEFLIVQMYLEQGLVARWKGNNFDQMAWDCYLGIAVACIKLKITSVPRDILSYGFSNWFIFNTDKKKESKDWLGRNVPIWPLMFCAAFPWLKYPMYPALYLIQLFFEDPKKMLDRNYTNGIQLQWVFLVGCDLLGFRFKSTELHNHDLMKKAFAIYYSPDHPFNNLKEKENE